MLLKSIVNPRMWTKPLFSPLDQRIDVVRPRHLRNTSSVVPIILRKGGPEVPYEDPVVPARLNWCYAGKPVSPKQPLMAI